MSSDRKLPVTIGTVTINSCEYQPPDSNGDFEFVDYFPEFLITGKVRLPSGEYDFVRRVAVELDGRDANQEHVSGLDLDDLTYDADQALRCQVDEDLYNAICGTPAYDLAARAYHGEPA